MSGACWKVINSARLCFCTVLRKAEGGAGTGTHVGEGAGGGTPGAGHLGGTQDAGFGLLGDPVGWGGAL
ncbi:unnamed protein product [Coccothraustes coccothraustes]